MKKIVAIGFFLMLMKVATAQLQKPVQWSFSAKKVNGSTYEVQLIATLSPGWHLYSQTTPEGGPFATVVTFTPNPLLILEGHPQEVGKLEQKYEPLFGVDVKQYSGKVVFVQAVRLKGKAKTALNGTVAFMACNDETCLPPHTQKFAIAFQ